MEEDTIDMDFRFSSAESSADRVIGSTSSASSLDEIKFEESSPFEEDLLQFTASVSLAPVLPKFTILKETYRDSIIGSYSFGYGAPPNSVEEQDDVAMDRRIKRKATFGPKIGMVSREIEGRTFGAKVTDDESYSPPQHHSPASLEATAHAVDDQELQSATRKASSSSSTSRKSSKSHRSAVASSSTNSRSSGSTTSSEIRNFNRSPAVTEVGTVYKGRKAAHNAIEEESAKYGYQAAVYNSGTTGTSKTFQLRCRLFIRKERRTCLWGVNLNSKLRTNESDWTVTSMNLNHDHDHAEEEIEWTESTLGWTWGGSKAEPEKKIGKKMEKKERKEKKEEKKQKIKSKRWIESEEEKEVEATEPARKKAKAPRQRATVGLPTPASTPAPIIPRVAPPPIDFVSPAAPVIPPMISPPPPLSEPFELSQLIQLFIQISPSIGHLAPIFYANGFDTEGKIESFLADTDARRIQMIESLNLSIDQKLLLSSEINGFVANNFSR